MKGQMKILADIFVALLTIAVWIAIYFAVIGQYLVIQITISDAEEERNAINMPQILLSSDKFAYSDSFRIYRGVLDEKKLDSLQQNPNEVFKEVGLKDYKYFIEIKNLDSGNSWLIGSRFDSGIEKTFSVAIKHGDEIQIGKMTFHLGMIL